jgi:hypothetical protein
MAHTLRPLSLGALLDETFDIYRHNFLLFLGISALPNIVLLLLQLGVASTLDPRREVGAVALIGVLTASVASLFVSAIVTSATTLAVSDVYLDRASSVRACFSRVRGKTLSVVYVSFAVSLIVGFGMLLCIVPGIYWAGLYAIAIPAVVLENIDGGQALTRSKELTRDYVWRMIVIYFLTTIFSVVVVTGLNAGVEHLGPTLFLHSGLVTKEALTEIMDSLGGVLFGPISAIGITLAYYDQRVRKEAFDIEHMMTLMSAPGSQAAGMGA